MNTSNPDYTIPFKIKHPVHKVRIRPDFDSPAFMYIKTFLKKTHKKICSLYLYASFDTVCVQIGHLFKAQCVLELSEEFRNRQHFPSKPAIF